MHYFVSLSRAAICCSVRVLTDTDDLGIRNSNACPCSVPPGVVGADVTGHNLPCETQPITSRLALICGTSSCHMAISERPLFVPGVWGPYYSAMVPGLWLNEGGQSATGKLLDHIIKGHAAFPELQKKAKESGENIYTFLNRHLEAIKKESALGLLTDDLHIWPDFHGNRSPLADPALKGMVVGLTLSQTLDDLARLYLATVQAVALGTRHILDTLQAAGHRISTLFMCGGLSKNLLFVQMHADITGRDATHSEGSARLCTPASRAVTAGNDEEKRLGLLLN
ncbi:UNVERIFIED_CONTAM: hypothetical protein FKN15_074486 [Acipenser sinensis]